MSFGICKKSTKNDKSSTFGRPKDALGDFFVRVGGRGGRPGKRFSHGFISFGSRFWLNYSTRLAPPSKDGVGGFKGLRPTRRPKNTKKKYENIK